MARKDKDARTVHRSGSGCRVESKQERRVVETTRVAGKAPKIVAHDTLPRGGRYVGEVREPQAAYGSVPASPHLACLHGSDVQEHVHQIKAGLPMACFDELREALECSQESLAAVAGIPSRTLARRRQEGRFRPDEGERVLRLAQVFQDVLRLFEGDVASARRWLGTPSDLFEDRTPLEYCDTEPGAGFVRDVVGRLEHGVFS